LKKVEGQRDEFKFMKNHEALSIKKELDELIKKTASSSSIIEQFKQEKEKLRKEVSELTLTSEKAT